MTIVQEVVDHSYIKTDSWTDFTSLVYFLLMRCCFRLHGSLVYFFVEILFYAKKLNLERISGLLECAWFLCFWSIVYFVLPLYFEFVGIVETFVIFIVHQSTDYWRSDIPMFSGIRWVFSVCRINNPTLYSGIQKFSIV